MTAVPHCGVFASLVLCRASFALQSGGGGGATRGTFPWGCKGTVAHGRLLDKGGGGYVPPAPRPVSFPTPWPFPGGWGGGGTVTLSTSKFRCR